MNQPVPDELISAYFDGEVTPDERSQVERLLESSPEFRQQLDDTSKLSALLHSFPREGAPPELAANIQKQVLAAVLTPPARTPTSGRSLRREWTAFGVGILATMASLFMFVRVNQPEPASPINVIDGSILSAKRSGNPRLSEPVAGVTVAATQLDGDLDMAHGSVADQELSKLKVANAPAAPAASAAKMDQWRDAELPSLRQLATNYAELNVNSATPQLQTDFLLSLTNGDVIVPPRIADPSNMIAVVDFAVVDIERGVNEWKLLLQKRSVQQLDGHDVASFAKQESLGESREMKEKESADKKLNRSDELQVFFVHAPGDQLAEAIEEFRKNHPDLNWSPQPPIELPLGSSLYESEGLTASTNGIDPSSGNNQKQNEASDDSKVVNAEAEFAFGALMARNGAVTSSADTDLNLAVPAADSKSKLSDQTNLARRHKDAVPVASQPVTEPLGRATDGNSLGIHQSQQSYFRVAVQNQAPSAQQSVAPGQRQNSAVPLLANNSLNYANGFGRGSTNRSRNSVSNVDGRNSRLVKMLIVLKSDPAASPPSP